MSIGNTEPDGTGSSLWMKVDADGRLWTSAAKNRRIVTQTLTLANTEYSVTLGSGVRGFRVKARHASGVLKVKFTSGGSEFWLFNGTAYDEDGPVLWNFPTLVLESPLAGTVAEIIELS